MTSSDPSFSPPGPSFGNVAILGVGLMGGSIGLALKSKGLAGRIVGVGRNPDRLQVATDMGAIDAFTTDLPDGLAGADLIILCTTISNIIDQIPAVLELAERDSVVTDIGSTKGAIVRTAGGDPRFAGGHPMCGSERAGVEASKATLYRGATWAVTPTESTSRRATGTVERLIEAVGAIGLTLDPDMHDAMVAVTSHLPHVIASGLMRQASTMRADISELPRMSAGSFADMTRVSASPASIWRDVCVTNREAVLHALQGFRAELKVLEEAVEASDAAAIEAYFAAGESGKRAWPARNGGE